MRDVIFLVKLQHQVNIKVLTDQRAWSIMVAALAEMQLRMLTESEFRNTLRELNTRRYRDLGLWSKPEQKAKEFKYWKAVTECFLIEVYTFSGAIDSISHHYFDGQQILFPDADRCLADLIQKTEKMVGIFDQLCVEEKERSYRIDLEVVKKGISNKSKEQTTYLVDMARAEALDAMGENRAATELVERHLEV